MKMRFILWFIIAGLIFCQSALSLSIKCDCDDGNACNGIETCDSNGACMPGTPVNCDDGIDCTADSCNADGSCSHTPGDSMCDDGNTCTDDSCNPSSGCVSKNNANPCDDGNACTEGDICSGGSCNPGTPKSCDDGNACNGIETCDPTSGCMAGASVNCDDGNTCTDDSCDPSTGCIFANNANPCEDGNACTEGDICSGGSCNPGTSISCNDGNKCTTDTCDPATGCTYEAVDYDDDNACTSDSCNPATGPVHIPISCDDGNKCTTDTCDPSTGSCKYANICDSCNTAWAFLDGGTCYPITGNWGWYVKIPAKTFPANGVYETSGDLWAGKAQCSDNKGYDVGSVDVKLTANDVSVNFILDNAAGSCNIKDVHIWVSNDVNGGNPIPKGGFAKWYTSEYVKFKKALDLNRDIYLAVHSGVCCSSWGYADNTMGNSMDNTKACTICG